MLGIAWIITNGWSYVMLALGSGYITFLWLPISPEKIATAAIAIVLLRVLFPNDEKTLAVLKDIYAKVKYILKRKKTEKDDIETDSSPRETRE